MTTQSDTPFVHLLNRMENAAQSESPFQAGYSDARKAVLERAADLEREISDLKARLAAMESVPLTDDERRALEIQDWSKLSATSAWIIIDRYADGWAGIAKMMDAWKSEAVAAEREACARVCESSFSKHEAAAAIRGRK